MEARHRASILSLARRQSGAEPDIEVARALDIVVAHQGDLLLALDQISPATPSGRRPERDIRQVKLWAERLYEGLLELLSEKLMVRPGVARELECCRGAVLATMAQRTAATGQISAAVAVLNPLLDRGTATATAVFLYKLPIGFVSENPFKEIHRVPDWHDHEERRRASPDSPSPTATED